MPSAHTGMSVRSMTLEQKVGQMFMLAFAGSTAQDAAALLRDHHVGACYLSNDNFVDPPQAAALAAELQALARAGSGIPALLAADQEGAWAVLTPHSCPGPGNMGLGATGSVEDTREMYSVFGQELRAAGLNADLAPAADVNSNPLNSIIGMRSFGEDPEAVARHVRAAVAGLHDAGIIAAAQHLPRHGENSIQPHPCLAREDGDRHGLGRRGRRPASRVDDAVARILALKARYGLADRPVASAAAAVKAVGSPAHREIERRVAADAVVLIQNRGGVVPLNAERSQRLVVLSATDEEGYHRMAAGRGIGPNVVERPAEVAFAEIRRRRPDILSLSLRDGEWEAHAGRLAGASAFVVVTEKFPLAGFDFPDATQHRLIQWLVSTQTSPVIVLACRDPYELAAFPEVDAYICAVGYRPAGARAAPDVLFGETVPRGRLPACIPGLYPIGHGVTNVY